MSRYGAVVAIAMALTATAVPSATAAPSASAASYVALGDSYTAAPGVQPLDPTAPVDCLRSSNNYPHLTAAALGLPLVDRSCNGATTDNMTSSQYPDQPPQFGALSSSTSVVTIGIGGNDNQLFISAISLCSLIDALDVLNVGAPCQSVFGTFFVDEANNDAAAVGQAFAAIHARSAAAKVFVVGYPDILPQRANCYPQLPLSSGDVAYLNQVELALNAMLQREAAAHMVTYVDTYGASVGHDACKSENTRWVEPILPGSLDAFPIHPNAKGEAADSRAVQAAMRAIGL